MGFEMQLPDAISVENAEIGTEEQKSLGAEDIIQDIVVHNDGDEQYSKLLAYISSAKASDLITKTNYKQLITRFLSENSTKIHIVAKPLKTEHCEKKFVNIMQPLYFCGRSKA
jgi:hypothetical protein